MTESTQGQVAYDASVAIVLAGEAQSALANAKEFVIDSPSMLEIAGEDLRKIKGLQKSVEEKRTGITGPLNQAVKAINALFKAPADYLDQAERTIKGAMITYTSEQERIATEQRRVAEAAAAAERARLAAEQAEQERQARAAAEAAEAATRAAAEAAAAGNKEAQAAAEEEARRQTAAAEAAAAEAHSTANTAEVISMPIAAAAPQKVSGVSGRVTYGAEVADLLTLVKAVAEGKAPLECIEANTKFLGAQARAFKKAGPLYPGVVAVAERGLSARAA